ncbi:MAG TPA: HPr family phosphocarrier protein [Spirochaetia bacterium]|nr:HPr family phosphocarrier protein [Spirochaetia bacterium]
MVSRTITIRNRAGIHARPAALIVQTANQYGAQVFFEKDTNRINGKSIMGIITLGATYNSTLTLITDGQDEKEALEAIALLFENKFEEA